MAEVASPKTRGLTSNMGWSRSDKIVVRGMDLCKDLLGKMSLGDMAWLEITGKQPTPDQSAVFNAVLVTLVEHGMTPMAMATRLTYLGAPEALQGAVASGLLGMGTTFAGTSESAAKLLQEAPPAPATVEEVAEKIVTDHLAAKRSIPGIGHPVHKPIDPRTPVLFDLAAKHKFSGRPIALMQAVARIAEVKTGKSLPVNATGAIAAIATELGLDWRICRGLAVIGRAVGLVGHISEELRNPIALKLWSQVDREVSEAAQAEMTGGPTP